MKRRIRPRGVQNAVSFIETLEGRRLLSGDITVVYDNGVLTITGSSKDDTFRVSTDTAGLTTVTPTLGTLLNGDAAPLSFSRVDSVIANTGNGDDYIEIEGFDVQDLIVDTGNGKDTVDIKTSYFFTLDIDTGGGVDTILMNGTFGIGNIASIDGGEGKDFISVVGEITEIKQTFTISGGNGSDVADISGLLSYPVNDFIVAGDVEQLLT
jgi:hypothetical protein